MSLLPRAPAPGVWRAFVTAGVRLLLLFAVVFYGAEWWTAQHTRRVSVAFAAELGIPWWPPAYLVYFSVLAVPFLVLVRASSRDQVRAWERRMALALLVALPCFLWLPSTPAYPPPSAEQLQRWGDVRGAAQLIAGRYNLLPSLHVALSAITMLAVAPLSSVRLRTAMALWWAALVAAVLLTHQHHLADVVAGVVLALLLRPWRGASPRL